MDGNFFFVIGGVLVAAALLFSFIGIRGSERFPPTRAVMAGLIAVFVAIVATTMAFAIVKSKDEQKKRNEKLAKEEQQAGGATTTAAGGGVATSLDLSSPADGSLVYQPDGLTANPGNLTITYDNPSQVPHSIAVATSNGNVLGQVQPFTNGKQSVTLNNLAPGKYVFYCTVPGHRQAGMQGNLTVLTAPNKR
ncbi:MAG: plastocyanin/azurin family copper-binding protein [Solirubrobacterales bacterium]